MTVLIGDDYGRQERIVGVDQACTEAREPGAARRESGRRGVRMSRATLGVQALVIAAGSGRVCDRALARSRATPVRNFRGALGRYVAKSGGGPVAVTIEPAPAPGPKPPSRPTRAASMTSSSVAGRTTASGACGSSAASRISPRTHRALVPDARVDTHVDRVVKFRRIRIALNTEPHDTATTPISLRDSFVVAAQIARGTCEASACHQHLRCGRWRP